MRLRSTLSFNLGGFVVAALFAAPQASAQANAAPEPLKFEVASVKVAASGTNGVRGGCRGVDSVYTEEQERGGIPALGRCRITDARLSHLIGIAYTPFGFVVMRFFHDIRPDPRSVESHSCQQMV